MLNLAQITGPVKSTILSCVCPATLDAETLLPAGAAQLLRRPDAGSETGGHSSETGGHSSQTGGHSSETGGHSSETGGHSSEAGGPSSEILRSSGQAAAESGRSELLRSVGHAVGHSRAGSIAGWESLEDMEDARSEMTSEAGSSGPFWLVPLPYAGLPSLRGRSVP